MNLPRLLAVISIAAVAVSAQTQRGNDTVVSIQSLIEKGQLDSAASLIQQALGGHADDAGLLNLRGVVYAQKGELTAARTDFAAAARLNPRLTPAWQNLGRACQQLKDVSCAVDSWQRVTRSKPADVEAHLALAELYFERGGFAESLGQLNASKTDNLALRVLDLCGLARIGEAKRAAEKLAALSDFSDADLAALHGPIDEPRAAEVLVVLASGLDSRNAAGVVTLQRLALAYERLKQRGEARKILERVALTEPNNAAHLFELARLAEEEQDHEGALGYLAHARDLEPNNPRVHFLFGAIAGELDLPIEAKQSLDKALAADPENPNYNYVMGTVILQTRDASTASSYLAKYVKAKPADDRGHYALGLAYFAGGDYEHAQQEMQLAQKAKTFAPAANYYLGRMARLDGDLDAAKLRLHEALALQPKFSEPHTELGRIAMIDGDLTLAHAELEQAVALSPQSFQANEQLLVLFKRTRDPRAAVQEEKLKKLDEERSKRAELMLRTLEMKP
jgi:tetratricopeptide (TPR) repeat protein